MLKNQPKSIFLSVNQGEDTNNFTASVKNVWFQEKIRDTDLEYISLDALYCGKASELTEWFVRNLLNHPSIAEDVATSLYERGYGSFGNKAAADGAAVGVAHFYVGDTVIPHSFPYKDGFLPDMNEYVGKKGEISSIETVSGSARVHGYLWPKDALTLVRKSGSSDTPGAPPPQNTLTDMAFFMPSGKMDDESTIPTISMFGSVIVNNQPVETSLSYMDAIAKLKQDESNKAYRDKWNHQSTNKHIFKKGTTLIQADENFGHQYLPTQVDQLAMDWNVQNYVAFAAAPDYLTTEQINGWQTVVYPEGEIAAADAGRIGDGKTIDEVWVTDAGNVWVGGIGQTIKFGDSVDDVLKERLDKGEVINPFVIAIDKLRAMGDEYAQSDHLDKTYKPITDEQIEDFKLKLQERDIKDAADEPSVVLTEQVINPKLDEVGKESAAGAGGEQPAREVGIEMGDTVKVTNAKKYYVSYGRKGTVEQIFYGDPVKIRVRFPDNGIYHDFEMSDVSLVRKSVHAATSPGAPPPQNLKYSFQKGDIVITNAYSEEDGFGMPDLAGKEGVIQGFDYITNYARVHGYFWPKKALTLVKKADNIGSPGAPPPTNTPTLPPPGTFLIEWLKRDATNFKQMEESALQLLKASREGLLTVQKLCHHDYQLLGETHTKEVYICSICQHQKSE